MMVANMHWVYLVGYCCVYVLLALNVLLKPAFYDRAAVVLYITLAVLAFALHSHPS
jgi:hypothetical protein